jgi:F-type H+-transporting ATPase subunit a
VSTDQAPVETMTDAQPTPATPTPATPRRVGRRGWLLLLVAMILVDVVAYIVVPPFPPGEAPGATCAFPACFINGNLEFPSPHVVIDLDPSSEPPAGAILTMDPSISSTILTLWIVGGLLLIGAFFLGRRRADVPGPVQNAAEYVFESLRDFAVSLGGPAAVRYVPIFAGFFLLILFSNWAGLIPPVGKVEFLRAPTSDVNVTIGLALVSWVIFEFEGFRRLGIKGYLEKFFPFYEFKNGIGAGAIALFVGLIELMLEFVKPLTLSMRLFGNIYGGEVALGVVTSLTLVLAPVALLGLEAMLNFIQALIFSVLTLMFILIAIESHHHEEGEIGEEAVREMEGRPHAQTVPAH